MRVGFLQHGGSGGTAQTITWPSTRVASQIKRFLVLHKELDADDGENNKSGMSDKRKIFVYTNEDKGAPAKLLLLKNFRTLAQVAQRVAQVFSLKPIKDLHPFEKFNLFYGWNGSGKSTLSKLFWSITDKKTSLLVLLLTSL